jgi:hypothetical protein
MKKLVAVAGMFIAVAAPAHAQTVQIAGRVRPSRSRSVRSGFSEYNKLDPDVQINDQSIGSGGRIPIASVT